MKYINILISILLIGVIIVTGYVLSLDKKLDKEVSIGTYLEGEDISGLSRPEVEKIVSNKVKTLNGQTVTLKLNQQQKTFKWSQLGIVYKEKDLVDKVFAEQDKKPLERVKMYFSRKVNPVEYTVEHFFEEEVFNSMFNESFPDIVRKPVNASLSIKGKEISIKGGDNGSVVNKQLLQERVIKANLSGETVVVIPLEDVEPETTVEDILDMGITKVIASYKTTFDPNYKGKVTNIGIASKEIEGIILAPGEIFDFNETTGRRTPDKGYVDATIFSGGKMIDDIGGGICQVSSTMYNAALYAGFEIVERHQHGLPVSYVPAGRDATLWYGSKNFRFKNTSGKHAYLQLDVGKNYLEVNIFGTKHVDQVLLESEILEKVSPPVREIKDPNLSVGDTEVVEKGAYGYKSVAYQIIKKDGKVVERKELSRDYYKPMERVIRVGTKKEPVESVEESNEVSEE
jgi:vancomycin resistance protein YoaR